MDIQTDGLDEVFIRYYFIYEIKNELELWNQQSELRLLMYNVNGLNI